MRHAAVIAGLIWMAAIAMAGLVLIGAGAMHMSRGTILILFCAAIPGFLLYRWGRRLEPVMPRRPARRR